MIDGPRAADWIVAGMLAAIVAGAALHRASLIHPVVFQYQAGAIETTDVWFDADLPKQACVMTSRGAGQHRVTSDHPLLSIAMHLPAALARGAGLNLLESFAVVVGLFAAGWSVMFFGLLRRIGCARIDAVVFALLAAVSSAGLFWMAVPEAYVAGSITMLVPLFAVDRGAMQGEWNHLWRSAVSLSVTTTNWMSGLLSTLAAQPWRRTVQISANALMLVTVLWLVQSIWFPANVFFLGSGRILELAADAERPSFLGAATVFFAHAVVMPEPAIVADETWRGLSVQSSVPGSSGVLGTVALVLWIALLIFGSWCLWRNSPSWPFRFALAGLVLGQLALHVWVGRETFLYSMHFVPLLVLVAACGTLGSHRVPVVAAAAVLTVLAGVNNWQRFDTATTFVNTIAVETLADGVVLAPAGDCQ